MIVVGKDHSHIVVKLKAEEFVFIRGMITTTYRNMPNSAGLLRFRSMARDMAIEMKKYLLKENEELSKRMKGKE